MDPEFVTATALLAALTPLEGCAFKLRDRGSALRLVNVRSLLHLTVAAIDARKKAFQTERWLYRVLVPYVTLVGVALCPAFPWNGSPTVISVLVVLAILWGLAVAAFCNYDRKSALAHRAKMRADEAGIIAEVLEDIVRST